MTLFLVWSDHFDAILVQFFVQLIAIVRARPNQVLGLRTDNLEVKTPHQGNYIVIGE